MLEDKKSTTESASSSSYSPKEFDAATQIETLWNKPTNVLNQIIEYFKDICNITLIDWGNYNSFEEQLKELEDIKKRLGIMFM